MLRRIGVALAAAMLLLPLTVMAQKSVGSRSSSFCTAFQLWTSPAIGVDSL